MARLESQVPEQESADMLIFQRQSDRRHTDVRHWGEHISSPKEWENLRLCRELLDVFDSVCASIQFRDINSLITKSVWNRDQSPAIAEEMEECAIHEDHLTNRQVVIKVNDQAGWSLELVDAKLCGQLLTICLKQLNIVQSNFGATHGQTYEARATLENVVNRIRSTLPAQYYRILKYCPAVNELPEDLKVYLLTKPGITGLESPESQSI